jgi:hypothetical protein
MLTRQHGQNQGVSLQKPAIEAATAGSVQNDSRFGSFND